MNWTLDQLKAFVVTVEKGSFSAASRAIGKAQSRISTAVSNLEIDMGLELFDRSARYPVLTEHGQALYQQALIILSQCERLDSQAKTLSSGQEVKLTLSLDEAVPLELIESLLVDVADKYPLLSLTLLHGTHGDVIQKVEKADADIGLITQKGSLSKHIELELLGINDLLIAVSNNHPLLSIKKIEAKDLAKYRQFVVCDKECRAYQTPISSNCWYTDSYYSALLLLFKGNGWAILPEYILNEEPYCNHITKLPISHIGQSLTMEISIIQRRDIAKGPISQWIISELKKSFSN